MAKYTVKSAEGKYLTMLENNGFTFTESTADARIFSAKSDATAWATDLTAEDMNGIAYSVEEVK